MTSWGPGAGTPLFALSLRGQGGSRAVPRRSRGPGKGTCYTGCGPLCSRLGPHFLSDTPVSLLSEAPKADTTGPERTQHGAEALPVRKETWAPRPRGTRNLPPREGRDPSAWDGPSPRPSSLAVRPGRPRHDGPASSGCGGGGSWALGPGQHPPPPTSQRLSSTPPACLVWAEVARRPRPCQPPRRSHRVPGHGRNQGIVAPAPSLGSRKPRELSPGRCRSGVSVCRPGGAHGGQLHGSHRRSFQTPREGQRGPS